MKYLKTITAIGILFITSSFHLVNKSNLTIQKPNSSSSTSDASKSILGYWTTEKKDLKVRVYLESGKYCGKLVDFVCDCKIKTSAESHKDTRNPDPSYRGNSWIGTKILWDLKYEGGDRWIAGEIYDMTSGGIYSSVVTLTNGKIDVRGYWGFEFIGKSMTFVRP